MTENAIKSNIPEVSVSALSLSLQRTLEDSYGRIRVRGEIAGLKIAASGHLYADLKDENANLNIICWRSTVTRLKIRPEDGMDVVCTGKITTYPKSSRYQMIVDSIELAGEGALLKMLEDRRKRLAAEGLFDPARKKPIPFLPRVIGVVTSPTGAVIRDILHRLNDRFPRHVIVWPVMVQGAGAPEQIADAIAGFNALQGARRPDIIIVARGGGSLEDLMAFNEEIVVRAAAQSAIPLISAIGHETDTTLIDYAADLRAPTPTAAAEMAVPVRADLIATLQHQDQRLYGAIKRGLTMMTQRIQTAAAQLGDPGALVMIKTQQYDHAAHRIDSAYRNMLNHRAARLAEAAAMLRHPRQVMAEADRTLAACSQRLDGVRTRLLEQPRQKLDRAASLLEAFSFQNVLQRGFALVRDEAGNVISRAATAQPGQGIHIAFADGERRATLEK